VTGNGTGTGTGTLESEEDITNIMLCMYEFILLSPGKLNPGQRRTGTASIITYSTNIGDL